MTSDWTFAAAFGLRPDKALVSIVGGGGKTSLLFGLAAAFAPAGRVVVTTTTRIFAAQMKLAPAVVYEDDLSPLAEALDSHRVCLVVGEVEGEKARGVAPDLPGRLLARPDVDLVLVEADGSRMRPVKAPAEHEPVIPPETTLLIPVAGLDALDGPLEAVAHRPDRIRAILGAAAAPERLTDDDRLTPAGLARLLADPRGGLKNAPAGARVIPLLNKVEDAVSLGQARDTAAWLLQRPHIERVVLGALRTPRPIREVHRRTAAVVLAAGLSSRMGHNKLLLPWESSTVLGRTLENLQRSRVADLVVVSGHEAPAVEAIAAAAGVRSISNPDYTQGMLTSLQAAVARLPRTIAAALVVLGDQPMVPPAVYEALLDAYARHPHGLVAPTFAGRRGNPVLIDRRYFDELLALPPTDAPRRLLERHPEDLLTVEVDTDAVLLDLDTPEAYEHLRPR